MMGQSQGQAGFIGDLRETRLAFQIHLARTAYFRLCSAGRVLGKASVM